MDKFGRAQEEVSLPGSVTDVRTLLAWLRTRGGTWEKSLQEDTVKVTLNRQFAEISSAVNDKMEIAIVPARLG